LGKQKEEGGRDGENILECLVPGKRVISRY